MTRKKTETDKVTPKRTYKKKNINNEHLSGVEKMNNIDTSVTELKKNEVNINASDEVDINESDKVNINALDEVDINTSDEVDINESNEVDINISEKDNTCLNEPIYSYNEYTQTISTNINDFNDFNLQNILFINEENLDIDIDSIPSENTNEYSSNNLLNEPDSINYTLNERELINILGENKYILNDTIMEYTLDDLKDIFQKFKEAIILVQIIDGNIKFVEKNGYESRNQSVIDLLIKTNNYKELPNIQFLVFTNDFIDNAKLIQYPYVFTFCKKYNYNTNLFPNFNFNNWHEANIGNYEDVYNNFTNQQIEWKDKKDIIFWSGSNTNTIRKKIYENTKLNKNYLINLIEKNKKNKYYAIDDHIKYKYLLNINGHSYAGRLNYLFLSGSCVIILKNEDKEKCWDEFFYKYFIPNEDYLEVIYNDTENINNIISRINNSISSNNCGEIAKKCYEKAKELFKINNIYEYIHNTLTQLSIKNIINNYLDNTIMYTPLSKNYFKDRLLIKDNNINFIFKGSDLEIKINDDLRNNIILKIIDNNTKIYFNENIILNKYTPYILNNNKNQSYQIIIDKNQFNIIVENKFNLINVTLLIDLFVVKNTEIKTELGGLWIL